MLDKLHSVKKTRGYRLQYDFQRHAIFDRASNEDALVLLILHFVFSFTIFKEIIKKIVN